MNELGIAILAGLGGMVGWGVADFFAKQAIDRVGDVPSLVLAHVAGTLGFLLAIAAHGSTQGFGYASLSTEAWVGTAVFGVVQAIIYLLVYRGFGKGQLALLNPTFASFSGLAALISVVAFGEALTGGMVSALATIFAGIILMNVDVAARRDGRGKWAAVPGFGEIAAATVLAGLWTALWGHIVSGQSPIVCAAAMYLFMTVFLLLYAACTRTPLRFSARDAWLLLLIGACEVSAYVAVTWGYARTAHVSTVALISGAFSLPTIMLARIWLKERTTRLQALASLMIVVGIVLLNVH